MSCLKRLEVYRHSMVWVRGHRERRGLIMSVEGYLSKSGGGEGGWDIYIKC